MNNEKEKIGYVKPVTEVTGLIGFNLLNPISWNPDTGHGLSIEIIEGEDDPGDGKGANESSLFDFGEDTAGGSQTFDLWDQF